MKTKIKSRTKSRTKLNKNIKNGGGILDSIGSAIVQVPKTKDYSVHIPG